MLYHKAVFCLLFVAELLLHTLSSSEKFRMYNFKLAKNWVREYLMTRRDAGIVEAKPGGTLSADYSQNVFKM